MRSNRKYILIIFSVLSVCLLHSQNETSKWLFGNYAGLDFMITPPAVVNTNPFIMGGGASMSDNSGKLLFYTHGGKIYNAFHIPMSNNAMPVGGNQPVIIVKKPGSTHQYLVLGTGANHGSLHFALVDMSLLGGLGSLVIQDSINSNDTLSGKITATRHCNGVDYWIIVRTNAKYYKPRNFLAYLLTSSGLSTSPVISPAFANPGSGGDNLGQLKVSPNGNKLAHGNFLPYLPPGISGHILELYDFDNSTGVVSNPLALSTYTAIGRQGYGCEFSPDGTKLYATRWDMPQDHYGGVYQWDLCSGTNAAIVASETLLGNTTNLYEWHADMQLARNGKIYISISYGASHYSLSVINNPNNPGTACNYSFASQNLAPGHSIYNLPNFVGNYFYEPSPVAPFLVQVSNSFGCQAASFSPDNSKGECSTVKSHFNSLQWDFGDPGSGANNTSTLINPVHAFTKLGQYTVTLVMNYGCGRENDTLRQPVNINLPCINIVNTPISCASAGSATIFAVGGPYTYTWLPVNQTGSVASGLGPGTYTVLLQDNITNITYTTGTTFNSSLPLTGNLVHSGSLTCHGVNNGSATVNNLSGGSGTTLFSWFNGTTTFTVSHPQNLSAGVWSLTVTDALTVCQIKEVFYLSQPVAQTLTLSSNTPTACAGATISLSGIAGGGTPGYTYSWTSGPALDTFVVRKHVAGAYVYTLNSWDANNCIKSNTIGVTFLINPVFTISNSSICPLQTGTVSVSGASTYTWSTGSNATFITDNPLSTTVYSLVGTALGCTSAATATITLKPIPVPVITSNSPRCNGQDLNLYASGGVVYLWTGPLSYTAGQQNPLVSNINTLQAGVYDVTVTALNSCTAAASATVVINPTPTLSASGSTVCVGQNLLLYANSFPGASFVWNGPGYTSAAQNPTISGANPANTGNYLVNVISAVGCTNTAVAHASVTPMPIPSFVTNSPLCFGKTLILDATNTIGAETFSWTGPNGFSSTLHNDLINNVTVPASGNYNLVVTAGPCTNSTNKQVVVNPLPTPTLSSNSPVCEGKELQLAADLSGLAILSFKWTGPDGFLSFDKKPSRLNSKSQYTGMYTLDVKDMNGCETLAVVQVAVYPNPTVTTSGALVCRYDAATITAQGAASYVWSGPYLLVSNDANGIVSSAQYADPQQYIVIGTAANGCTSIATATVTTRLLPVPTISIFPKSRLCINETATLVADGGSQYLWTSPLGATFSGKDLILPLRYSALAGTYSLIAIDDANCKGHATALLEVDELPQGTLMGKSMNSCVPFCADYTFESPLTSSSRVEVTWEINNQIFRSRNFTYCFKHHGEYLVKGSFRDTTLNCSREETYLVNAYAKPAADFSYVPEKPVGGIDEIVFTNAIPEGELSYFKWFVSDENYSSRNQQLIYQFDDPGTYMVALVITDNHGCTDTVVKPVVVQEDFHMYIPNAFTPNGDQLNNVFMPSVRGINEFDMKVFNRWGALLFESKESARGWDGDYKGENCKQDVYVYKIKVRTFEGETRNYSGQVTLYR